MFVVSISHQSRASLAMAYNVSIENMDKCLIDLFIRQMGFTYIVGTSLGRKLSLINEAKEIINRKTKVVVLVVLTQIPPQDLYYHQFVLVGSYTLKRLILI